MENKEVRIKVGDCVRLKSDSSSPIMCVSHIDEGLALCHWYVYGDFVFGMCMVILSLVRIFACGDTRNYRCK